MQLAPRPLPTALLQDRKKLLSFVIVGGGPTGVEVAAELYDMITEDMRRLYPALMDDVCIRVVELMDYVLSAYDRKLGEYTARLFKRNGIELVRPSARSLAPPPPARCHAHGLAPQRWAALCRRAVAVLYIACLRCGCMYRDRHRGAVPVMQHQQRTHMRAAADRSEVLPGECSRVHTLQRFTRAVRRQRHTLRVQPAPAVFSITGSSCEATSGPLGARVEEHPAIGARGRPMVK